MKLNLFCGFDHRDGYINIDAVVAFKPDIVLDLRRDLPYAVESIEEIRIQDGFEHLNYIDAIRCLRHWALLLIKGGILYMQLPDWELIDKSSLAQVFGALSWKGVQLGDFGVHKWGYTKDSIRTILAELGFGIKNIWNKAGNMIVIATKTSAGGLL